MKSNSSIFIIVVLGFLVFSLFPKCANKVPPSGGPRDSIPPSLIYSNPRHQSVNVHTRVYEFQFDERIQLNNLKKQLLITPKIDFNYETKPGKKGFILVFEKDFAENTTYTFNFREAIQDVKEKNPTLDNKLSFSTGEFLDSLSIEGYAINLLKNDTLKKATIGLYVVEDTVTIQNGSPYYFTQTTDSGYYKIENIKNGKYLLYGFVDGNSNLKLEPNGEPYALKSDTLNLQQNVENLNLYFIRHDVRPFRIQTALPSGKHFDINFNKYIINYDIAPLYDPVKIYSAVVKENKSIRVYNTFFNPDSTAVFVSAIDSTENLIQDTVWVKFNESKRAGEALNLTLTPDNGGVIDENFVANFKFNKPIRHVDYDSIIMRYDTIPIAVVSKPEQILTNKNQTKFEVRIPLSKPQIDSVKTMLDSLRSEQEAQLRDSLAVADSLTQEQTSEPKQIKRTMSQGAAPKQQTPKGLHLYLGKTAFISVEQDSFPQKMPTYKFANPEDYGIISGTVETEYPSFILQLTNERQEVIKEIVNQKKFEFTLIPPGKYRLRLLIDANENGVWEYGNLYAGIEPEPVIHFLNDDGTPTISVRANWDIRGLVFKH